MSKILDRLRDSGDSNGRCHVRVSDNMTYGPVALTTVCQWAAQGRVTAESEISFDRNEWVRADSIPELGLEWVASSDGADDFGPFNMMALSALVRRGLISPDARLKQRETDETLDVPQALARATASRPLDAAASRLLQTVQATGSDEGQSVASQSGALEADGTTAVAAAGSDALVSELRQELAAAQTGNFNVAVTAEMLAELAGRLEDGMKFAYSYDIVGDNPMPLCKGQSLGKIKAKAIIQVTVLAQAL